MKRSRKTLAVSIFLSAISLFIANDIAAQTVDVLPDEIPNGVLSPSTFRQRLDVTLVTGDTGLSRSLTITLPSEVSIVSGSATATTNSSAVPHLLPVFRRRIRSPLD